ncbi:MAG: hypothetical protein ACKPKO_29225 [Candidatus Fonsibacter sp.]
MKDCTTDQEVWENNCNALVDTGAKAAVGMHPQPEQLLVNSINDDFQFAKDGVALAMQIYNQSPMIGTYNRVARGRPIWEKGRALWGTGNSRCRASLG